MSKKKTKVKYFCNGKEVKPPKIALVLATDFLDMKIAQLEFHSLGKSKTSKKKKRHTITGVIKPGVPESNKAIVDLILGHIKP